MCLDCLRVVCVPTCPSYTGAASRLFCTACEESIPMGEAYFLLGSERICETCAAHMDLDELADLLGGTRETLLCLLGGTKETA